jgi:hypothetical protein
MSVAVGSSRYAANLTRIRYGLRGGRIANLNRGAELLLSTCYSDANPSLLSLGHMELCESNIFLDFLNKPTYSRRISEVHGLD